MADARAMLLERLSDAGDGLARHWLAFLTFDDLQALSSVRRHSPLRLALATRGVWRLPYPSEWKVRATSNAPQTALSAFDWRWYVRGTYLHRMDPEIKRHLRAVAVPRSAMLSAVMAHLPTVTSVRTWQFDGDVAGITQLSPLERRRVYKQMREIDLRELDGAVALESLQLFNASVANLHYLRSLRGLTSLDLSRADVDRQHSDFKWLASLSQLEVLNLDRTGLSDLGFLASLPRLRTLHMVGAAVGSLEGLAAVGSTLTSLDVSNVWLESERVDLSFLTNLRDLRAELLGAMNPLDIVLNAPSLASCSFRYCWLQHRAFLSACPLLQNLDLRDVILFDDTQMKLSPQLKTLQLSSNPAALRSIDWPCASQLETLQLRKWDPAFVDADRIDGSFLAVLPRLRTLEIAKLSKYSALPSTSPRVVSLTIHQLKAANAPMLQELLATNDRLETLCLSAERAVELALPALAAPMPLRSLELLNVTITNLDALASCQQLRRLAISGFGTIPNAAALAVFLPHCVHLKTLEICQNTAFDDVSPLAALPNLEVLNVRHTSVASIAAIAGMRSLRQLDLGYTPVTSVEAVRSLSRLTRVVLPGPVPCELFHDADAFPRLRSVVHEYVNGARDCLLTGHDAIIAA